MTFLDRINAEVSEILGPMGLVIIFAFLGILLIAFVLAMLLKRPEDPLDRLKRENARQRQASKEDAASLRQADHNEQLKRFATFLEPKNVEELSAKQLELRQAGYTSRDAVRLFSFAQMTLGLIGVFAGVVYVNFLGGGQGMSTQKMMIYSVLPGAIGYYLPKYWITRKVETRKQEIEQGFPDALDLMLVCMEAGQSMDQSIVRVSKELRASYAALAQEFEIVAYEMKAGKERTIVLNDMGRRCGVQDVSSFVTVLVQSASFGTSVSDALRVYASEMRDKRVMRAEEAANKLPTKMTLATMLLTVPPLLIILVGPSVHGITQLGNLGQ